LAKSVGNEFSAEFTPKSAGKSVRKVRSSSNGRACYKESRSWVWASAQASWGWLHPELVKYSKFNMTAKIQDQHHSDDFIFF